MSDTASNRLAGGPKLFLAAAGVALPSLNVTTLDLENDEVQTITKSGTVSGGTFTLEFVHPDTGESETTAAIDYNDIAADIQTAILALPMFASGDVVVTGGPASTNPIVLTFGGNFTNIDMPLVTVDDALITGGGTLSSAETTKGRLWSEQPDIVSAVEVKPVYTTDDHAPVHSMFRTGDTPKEIGLDTLTYEIEESDLDAHNIGLLSTLKTVTSAGVGTVGRENLKAPGPYDINTVQALLQYRGPVATGWGILRHIYRMKRQIDQPFTTEKGVRKIKIVWKIFADADHDDKCDEWYEYKQAATS